MNCSPVSPVMNYKMMLKKKFNLTDQDYNDGIDDIVEDHMCNVCDWYDKMLFGENAGDFLGMNKGVNDLMAHMRSLSDKTDDGIKL